MTSQEVRELTDKYFDLEAEKRPAFVKENREKFAAANKASRKLQRVGMPVSTRFDSYTDEKPILAGGKRVITYGGGSIALAMGAVKLWKWIF